MQKVKHDFHVANQEISFEIICMVENGFTLFDRNPINCLQYSERCNSINQTRSQSRNEINTHTEHLVQKHNDLL